MPHATGHGLTQPSSDAGFLGTSSNSGVTPAQHHLHRRPCARHSPACMAGTTTTTTSALTSRSANAPQPGSSLTTSAGAAAASLQQCRPGCRPALPSVDPAGRVLSHPGARPPVARSRVLRGRDSRESGPGSTGPGAIDLRPARQQAHAISLPHPSDHAGVVLRDGHELAA